MSNDDATQKKSLGDKVKGRLSTSSGEVSHYRELALDALASLLSSDDEAIRLQAAQALLQHVEVPEKRGAGASLVKKLTGRIRKT